MKGGEEDDGCKVAETKCECRDLEVRPEHKMQPT